MNMKKALYDLIYDETSYCNTISTSNQTCVVRKNRDANIPKKHVIDEMATAVCLLLYHCVFNPIKKV